MPHTTHWSFGGSTLVPSPTKANIYHLTTQMLGMCSVFRCMYFSCSSFKRPEGFRGWRGAGGTPSMFAEVFVLLFLCFWRAFSLYSLLTVSNVPFLFEHLFTYCVIDSDLKRASFILFHSLLCQFDSVFLKWGNSSCTVYSLCRISVIACVCNCLQCCRFPFSFFIYDVFI